MMARARQGMLPLQRPVVDSRPEERNGHYIGGFLSRHALRRGEAGQYASVLGLLLYVVGRPECYCLDGKRRVVAVVRRKNPTAHEEEVRHLMRATVAVNDRVVRVLTHCVGAHLVRGDVVGRQERCLPGLGRPHLASDTVLDLVVPQGGLAVVAASALIRGDVRTYLTLVPHADEYTLMDPFGGEPTRGFDASSER